MIVTLSVAFLCSTCVAEEYQYSVSRGESSQEFVYSVSRGYSVTITKPVLGMYTKTKCNPCKVGKAALEAVTDTLPFKLECITLSEDEKTEVPYFIWESPNGTMAITGWYGTDHLVKEWTRTQTKFKSVPVVKRQQNNYRMQWIIRSGESLPNHLLNTHGINPAGMSEDDMERAHDNAHNSGRHR